MVYMVAGTKFNFHFSLLRVKMDAEKTTVALKEVNILPLVLEVTLIPNSAKHTFLFYAKKCFCNMYL